MVNVKSKIFFYAFGALMILFSIVAFHNDATIENDIQYHITVLAQILFLVEGIFVIFLPHFIPQKYLNYSVEKNNKFSANFALIILILLGTFLRFKGIDSSLWIDEIESRVYNSDQGFVDMLIHFRLNNHILNTITTNFLVSWFGEHEVVVRLSAVLFSIATLIIFYYAAMRLFSEKALSIAATLLLVCSYHHIFFSQNSRGYSAYLFFSLATTILFVKMISQRKILYLLLYVFFMWCNSLSFLLSAFVMISHVTMCGFKIFFTEKAQRGDLIKWFFITFFITSTVILQTYLLALPQVYQEYKTRKSTFKKSITEVPVSGEKKLLLLRNSKPYIYPNSFKDVEKRPILSTFLNLFITGLKKGFSFGIVSLLLLFFFGACGLCSFVYRKDFFFISLLLVPVSTAIFFAISKNYVFPRFFILLLVIGILSTIEGLRISMAKIPQKWYKIFAISVIVFLTTTLALPLKNYYETPKQSYKESLIYLNQQCSTNSIILTNIYVFGSYSYYANLLNISAKNIYMLKSKKSDIDKYLSQSKEVWLAVAPMYSNYDWTMIGEWEFIRRFPATIQNGEIYLWKLKTP